MKLFGRQSITFRLTLLFASVSTTVLLLLGLLVGALVEQHFEDLDMDLLRGKVELIEHALKNAQSKRDLDALPVQLRDALIGHHGLAVMILAPDRRILFATASATFPAVLLATDARPRPLRPTVWRDTANHSYRGVSTLVRTGIADLSTVIIAVSTDLSHHEHFMQSFRVALWSVVGAAALLTGFLGWIAARRGLAPLREIREEAAAITASHLDRRLSVAAIPVELAEVAATLNDMLARLEESFKRLSDFSADIAHELRTPVSNLLTQTQVTLSKARTTDTYRDILASNAEEFERLSRMIADMLFLAKSDNGLAVRHRERVDLASEVHGLFEFYEALAEEKRIRMTCSGSGVVSGDRLMLRRSISNLLSNAVRHSHAGTTIAVRLDDAENSAVTLAVDNCGETIPPEHLPRLFDRFYRAESSRRLFGEGAGLGLAIARSVARAHGGDAFVRSANGVTTFKLWLPA